MTGCWHDCTTRHWKSLYVGKGLQHWQCHSAVPTVCLHSRPGGSPLLAVSHAVRGSQHFIMPADVHQHQKRPFAIPWWVPLQPAPHDGTAVPQTCCWAAAGGLQGAVIVSAHACSSCAFIEICCCCRQLLWHRGSGGEGQNCESPCRLLICTSSALPSEHAARASKTPAYAPHVSLGGSAPASSCLKAPAELQRQRALAANDPSMCCPAASAEQVAETIALWLPKTSAVMLPCCKC